MILITEDIAGHEYDALGVSHGLLFEPDLWRSPARLAAVSGPEIEAVIVRNRTRVDDVFLDRFPRLKAVGRAGVGLDNIDLPAAAARGIAVVVPLGANASSVAEHAVMLALTLSKNVLSADAATKSGSWNRVPNRELRGKTWGLISVGSTSRATARLVRSFGMTVLGYDPYVSPEELEIRELGVRMASLDEVLSSSDFISVHLPATPSTERMLGRRQFGRMKPGSIFINVGRGEVVDEDALEDALLSGLIAGAGLDVRATEPPRHGRLEGLPNVILTPHVAGITAESQSRIAQIVCAQISTILNGGVADARYLADAGVRGPEEIGAPR